MHHFDIKYSGTHTTTKSFCGYGAAPEPTIKSALLARQCHYHASETKPHFTVRLYTQ